MTTLQNDTKDRFQPIESLLFKKQHQTVGRNANQLRRNVPSATLQDRQNAARRDVTNLANLTLMSITPQNGMVAITQSTELFAQVPVDNEQIVSNPEPRTLPRNLTPQKQREHHLSSSSDSSSSSSETDEEPPPKRPQKKKDGKKERSSAAKELARPPANEWHNNLVPLNKLASLSTSQISKLDDVNEVDDQIRDLTPEIDDINLTFQSEGLAKKVPPGAKFGGGCK